METWIWICVAGAPAILQSLYNLVLDIIARLWDTESGGSRMKKLVTLTRNGKTIKILLHRDIPAIVGKKLQLDSGPMWLVLEVSE